MTAFKYIPLADVKFFRDESNGLVTNINILEHAYRLNGKVDVFKNGFCVYQLGKHEYTTLKTREEVFPLVTKILNDPIDYYSLKAKEKEKKSEPKPKIEKVGGKITFQEFKKRQQVADWRPEQYHWDNFKNQTSEDHLYFIKDGDAVKVGRSVNPKERLKTLQTASKTKLTLLFVVKNKGCLEKNIHSCLDKLHIRGEWYKYTDRVNDLFTFIYNTTPELVIKKPSFIKKKAA